MHMRIMLTILMHNFIYNQVLIKTKVVIHHQKAIYKYDQSMINVRMTYAPLNNKTYFELVVNFERLHVCDFLDDFFTHLLSLCGSFESVMQYCSCNGRNAVSKRCMYPCTKKPCATCRLPMEGNKCVNTLLIRVTSVTDSSRNCVLPIAGDRLVNWVWNGLTDGHISLAIEVNNSPGLSCHYE